MAMRCFSSRVMRMDQERNMWCLLEWQHKGRHQTLRWAVHMEQSTEYTNIQLQAYCFNLMFQSVEACLLHHIPNFPPGFILLAPDVAREENVINFASYTNKIKIKNAVFWDVWLCRSSVNRRFGGTYRLHLQGRKIREWGASLSRWLQTAMEAISSSETLVYTRSTQRHIPEDCILHSHRCEYLKSYKIKINRKLGFGDIHTIEW
jgi:hypothetical protein